MPDTAPTRRPDATLAPIIDSTAEDVRVRFLLSLGSENTRKAYARDLADWGRWLVEHGHDPLTVTRAHVDAYARQLQADGKSPATVARRLATLAGYYRYAVDEDVLARNPVERVKRPKTSGDS